MKHEECEDGCPNCGGMVFEVKKGVWDCNDPACTDRDEKETW